MKITKIPWRVIRRVGYVGRRVFFDTPKPVETKIVVDKPLTEVEKMFQKEHLREGWWLSYYYRGEDSNLSRAEFKDDKYENYQFHVRLFGTPDGKTEIYTHLELDPVTYPKKHLKNVNYSNKEGIKITKGILDQHKVPYKVVE